MALEKPSYKKGNESLETNNIYQLLIYAAKVETLINVREYANHQKKLTELQLLLNSTQPLMFPGGPDSVRTRTRNVGIYTSEAEFCKNFDFMSRQIDTMLTELSMEIEAHLNEKFDTPRYKLRS